MSTNDLNPLINQLNEDKKRKRKHTLLHGGNAIPVENNIKNKRWGGN